MQTTSGRYPVTLDAANGVDHLVGIPGLITAVDGVIGDIAVAVYR